MAKLNINPAKKFITITSSLFEKSIKRAPKHPVEMYVYKSPFRRNKVNDFCVVHPYVPLHVQIRSGYINRAYCPCCIECQCGQCIKNRIHKKNKKKLKHRTKLKQSSGVHNLKGR